MCGHDPVEHSSGELLSSALTECFKPLPNHRVLIIVFSSIISPELIKEIFIARKLVGNQLEPLIVNGDSKLDDGKISIKFRNTVKMSEILILRRSRI